MATDTPPKPTAAEPEPLLDINGLSPERPTVRLKLPSDPEGTLYELKLLAEYGIADQQKLVTDGRVFDQLFNAEKLNNGERKRLKQILDRMFDTVLMAPKEVKDECNDHVRSQVVTAFTVAPLVMAQAAEQKTEEKPDEDEPEPSDDSTTET